MLAKRTKKLYGIDPKSWEHPADKATLSALRQLKGVDELTRQFVSVTTERSMNLMHTASSVRVSETQYPRVNRLAVDIVDTFDWPQRPTIFVTQSPFFNAGTFGVKEPFIVLNSSIVKSFDEEELKAILAHEMGHVMSGHGLYKTLIWMLTNISMKLIPMAEILLLPILAALAEWDRKSELTADRAGLLACQAEEPSYNVLMKMSGGDDLSEVNVNDFFIQAQEYEARKSLLDSFHKLLNQLWLTHPYPVVRLQELRTWASSGAYAAILDGNYLKREFHEENVKEDVAEGYEYYRSSINNADDPLSKLAANIGNGIEKAVGDIGEKLKEILGGD